MDTFGLSRTTAMTSRRVDVWAACTRPVEPPPPPPTLQESTATIIPLAIKDPNTFSTSLEYLLVTLSSCHTVGCERTCGPKKKIDTLSLGNPLCLH